MEEIAKLKAALFECRRHSDNHRRSRDYHKEANALLRKDIEDLKIELSAFKNGEDFHSKLVAELDDELEQCQRHHRGWMAFAIIMASYALAMTVLFAWCVRS